MTNFSMKPSKHIEWIYDTNHPEYNSERAKDLRLRRQQALNECPRHLIEIAMMNDRLNEEH